MARKKSKPEVPFLGRRSIVAMTEWHEDNLDEEVGPFIEFAAKGGRAFQFGAVRGILDYREGLRANRPRRQGHRRPRLPGGRGPGRLRFRRPGDRPRGLDFEEDPPDTPAVPEAGLARWFEEQGVDLDGAADRGPA